MQGTGGLGDVKNASIFEKKKQNQDMWVQGQLDEIILEHVEFEATEDHLEGNTKKVISHFQYLVVETH